MTGGRIRNGPRGPYRPYAREWRGDGSKTATRIMLAAVVLFALAIVWAMAGVWDG